jgi:hypothetical protein
MFIDDVKRGGIANTLDDLALLQDSLVKKIPKIKDLTKKKNV